MNDFDTSKCTARMTGLDAQEWKRRQALQVPAPRPVEPTLPERINRLSPFERGELRGLIRSMKLRKIIRRTLAEAFWARQADELERLTRPNASDAPSMQRLRALVRQHESTTSYEGVSTHFEPVYTHSTHGDGNDLPAVTQALKQSLLIQRG